MDDDNALGDHLRARRELVAPADVGIVTGGPGGGRAGGARRVPGLRREEVAMLAGISADYYLRLEQGRDRNPSLQVVEALARALLLDEDATAHLLALSLPRARRPPRPRRERVPAGIAALLEVIALPAFVEDRRFDVLASNAMARALSPRLVAGRNRLRDVFLDPGERAAHPRWDHAAAGMVAGFRSSVGTETADPRVVELVGALATSSEPFARLWARHDVRTPEGGPTVLRHPEVGDLVLRREKLAVAGTDGQLLVVYHAEPGSGSAGLLALLGSLAATGGA